MFARGTLPAEDASCVLVYHVHAIPTEFGQFSYGAQRPGAEKVDNRDGLLQGTFYFPSIFLLSILLTYPVLFIYRRRRRVSEGRDLSGA